MKKKSNLISGGQLSKKKSFQSKKEPNIPSSLRNERKGSELSKSNTPDSKMQDSKKLNENLDNKIHKINKYLTKAKINQIINNKKLLKFYKNNNNCSNSNRSSSLNKKNNLSANNNNLNINANSLPSSNECKDISKENKINTPNDISNDKHTEIVDNDKFNENSDNDNQKKAENLKAEYESNDVVNMAPSVNGSVNTNEKDDVKYKIYIAKIYTLNKKIENLEKEINELRNRPQHAKEINNSNIKTPKKIEESYNKLIANIRSNKNIENKNKLLKAENKELTEYISNENLNLLGKNNKSYDQKCYQQIINFYEKQIENERTINEENIKALNNFILSNIKNNEKNSNVEIWKKLAKTYEVKYRELNDKIKTYEEKERKIKSRQIFFEKFCYKAEEKIEELSKINKKLSSNNYAKTEMNLNEYNTNSSNYNNINNFSTNSNNSYIKTNSNIYGINNGYSNKYRSKSLNKQCFNTNSKNSVNQLGNSILNNIHNNSNNNNNNNNINNNCYNYNNNSRPINSNNSNNNLYIYSEGKNKSEGKSYHSIKGNRLNQKEKVNKIDKLHCNSSKGKLNTENNIKLNKENKHKNKQNLMDLKISMNIDINRKNNLNKKSAELKENINNKPKTAKPQRKNSKDNKKQFEFILKKNADSNRINSCNNDIINQNGYQINCNENNKNNNFDSLLNNLHQFIDVIINNMLKSNENSKEDSVLSENLKRTFDDIRNYMQVMKEKNKLLIMNQSYIISEVFEIMKIFQNLIQNDSNLKDNNNLNNNYIKISFKDLLDIEEKLKNTCYKLTTTYRP